MSKIFTVVPLTFKEANNFVDEHHSHNKRVQGYKFAIGALHENILVGVAMCGRPISATLDNKKTIELLRSCVLNEAPKNTNSFLYGRSWRVAEAMGYEKMITYTLIREKGSACKAIGMKIVGQTKDSTKSWARKEQKDGIKRKTQNIYKELKYRWEINKL
tara:strand:+ start:43 stop:522 length:480 start_codon:yes stop_codon:yes gene_type:complete